MCKKNRPFWMSIVDRFKSEDGNGTVEFVYVFTPVFLLFTSAYEIGLANVQHVMLERGTDIAVRELRLSGGQTTQPDHELVRETICDVAFVIPDCRNVVQVRLGPVDMSDADWDLMDGGIDCIDRTSDEDPVLRFQNGGENELMLVRVCAIIDPIFPKMGLGEMMPKDASGGYALVATSAYVNEPN